VIIPAGVALDERQIMALVEEMHDGEIKISKKKMRKLGNCDDGLLCRTGLEWHSDGVGCWTLLHCIKTPAQGGDTLFASTYDMFDRLDEQSKAEACGALIRYGSRFTSGKGSTSAVDCKHGFRMNMWGTKIMREARTKSNVAKGEPSTLPFVFYDHRKLRSFITVDIRHMENVVGLDVKNSREKVDNWLRQGLLPQTHSRINPKSLLARDDSTTFSSDAVYRHKWTPGDIVIWDNNAMLHTPTAVAPYDGEVDTREMIQVIYRVPGYNRTETPHVTRPSPYV